MLKWSCEQLDGISMGFVPDCLLGCSGQIAQVHGWFPKSLLRRENDDGVAHPMADGWNTGARSREDCVKLEKETAGCSLCWMHYWEYSHLKCEHVWIRSACNLSPNKIHTVYINNVNVICIYKLDLNVSMTSLCVCGSTCQSSQANLQGDGRSSFEFTWTTFNWFTSMFVDQGHM